MKVMIIDDDAEDAMFLHEVILEVAPAVTCHITHTYSSAREHLEEETAPDFIFLDALMYPIGGKEALTKLNEMAKLTETIIIINSGALSPVQAEEFFTLGADRVFQKPADYHTLKLTVKEILSS